MTLQKTAIQAEGQCLGSEGISMLMSHLQNMLVAHGYITTRVVAAPQDLSSGTLTLTLIKGQTRHIAYAEDSDQYAGFYTAMPAREGEILDLRDIEQGLENLQRLPTVSAQMELVPGAEPGESDIVITEHNLDFGE